MITMTHYWNENKDGSIHVQNAVTGMMGQHHIHTKDDFEKWATGKENLEYLDDCDDCDCGLKLGETKSGR